MSAKYPLLLGVALLGSLFASCRKERPVAGPDAPRVEITIPGFEETSGSAAPATRGMTAGTVADSKRIDDVWLLFFDRNADESQAIFKTMLNIYNPDDKQGISETVSGLQLRQTIDFKTTAVDDGVDPARSYDVLVLANMVDNGLFSAVNGGLAKPGADGWSAYTAQTKTAFAGKSLAEIRDLLQLDHSSYYNAKDAALDALPMSAKTVYDPDRQLVEARLSRAVAKIVFRVTANANYFARSVRLANMRRYSYAVDPGGKIRPETLGQSFPQSSYVTYSNATVPEDGTMEIATDQMASADFDWTSSPAQDIVFYCAEAYNDAIETADKNTTCLILEARLKDETEASRYYRIDLASLNSDTGKKWQYIGRNKAYTYTLETISAAGFDTPGEALDNKPLKILIPGTSDAGWDDQGTHPTHYLSDGRSLLVSLHKLVPKWFFDDTSSDVYYTDEIKLYWGPDAPERGTLSLGGLKENPTVTVNGTETTILQNGALTIKDSETISIGLLKRNLYPESAGPVETTFDMTYTPAGGTESHTFTFTIAYE